MSRVVDISRMSRSLAQRKLYRRRERFAMRLHVDGCTNRPFYHIVLIKKHKGTNQPYTEQLGTFDPIPNIHGEQLVSLNLSRISELLSRGIEPTKPLAELLGLSGFLPIHPRTYLEAYRNRKEEAQHEEDETGAEGQKQLESAV